MAIADMWGELLALGSTTLGEGMWGTAATLLTTLFCTQETHDYKILLLPVALGLHFMGITQHVLLMFVAGFLFISHLFDEKYFTTYITRIRGGRDKPKEDSVDEDG